MQKDVQALNMKFFSIVLKQDQSQDRGDFLQRRPGFNPTAVKAGERSGTGAGFPPSTSFPLPLIIPPMLHSRLSSLLSSGVGAVGLHNCHIPPRVSEEYQS